MSDAATSTEPVVALARKVAWLSSHSAWPDTSGDIRAIETSMSWVFLVGEHACKLKKPIRTPALDFSTLAARERHCHMELVLNRRLAPDIYRCVRPVLCGGDGALSFHGPGTIVDWLVCMRRLDPERMLDRLIETDRVFSDDVDALSTLLARFYAGLEPVSMSSAHRLHQLRARARLDRETFESEAIDLPHERFQGICAMIERLLDDPPRWLIERTRRSAIVEGHGDLRLEHVSLARPPAIIDCLEFDRRLRLVDPFEELAGLRMECQRLDARWIGDGVIRHCSAALDDRPPPALLAMHSAMQACLRARLALQHLVRPPSREPARWLPRARSYLALAERNIEELVELHSSSTV